MKNLNCGDKVISAGYDYLPFVIESFERFSDGLGFLPWLIGWHTHKACASVKIKSSQNNIFMKKKNVAF